MNYKFPTMESFSTMNKPNRSNDNRKFETKSVDKSRIIFDGAKITNDAIDKETIKHCNSMISTFSNSQDIRLESVDAGVWNNVVIKAITPEKSYFFKQYNPFADIPNYSPPNISTEQRASVAQIAQSAASQSFTNNYPLVPSILAKDSTAFVMEAIPDANHLLGYLSSGICPSSVTDILPSALARFHSTERSERYAATALSDTTFRDYKVDLQYKNIAKLLDPQKREILQNFAEWYKQQKKCMTHGDLNSKNVLITSNNLIYVIDFEQAHIGTPAYDLAFILSELFIAEIQHKPNESFRNLSQRFVKQYLNTLDGYDKLVLEKETTLHFAAQVAYRFKGPSHKVWTSYVSPTAKQEAMTLAEECITQEPLPITKVLDLVGK